MSEISRRSGAGIGDHAETAGHEAPSKFLRIAALSAALAIGFNGSLANEPPKLVRDTYAMNFPDTAVGRKSTEALVMKNKGGYVRFLREQLEGPGFTMSGIRITKARDGAQEVLSDVTFAPSRSGGYSGEVDVRACSAPKDFSRGAELKCSTVKITLRGRGTSD